jgi:PPM family protein phosphatase
MVRTKLICAAQSHPGLVRTNNEDRVYFDLDRGIFLVIDGIGGQNAGEKAAHIAETRIRRRLERQTGSAEERVREAITVANNEIAGVAHTNPEWQGMACVLTVALVEDGTATIGHVGDSRLYKLRGGKIEKITHDHSPVGEREDSGELSEAEAMRHPRRNEVFRDVGSEEHTPDDAGFIEVVRIPMEPDAALLMCSDGLTDQVPAAAIQRAVVRHAARLDAAVQELIEAANVAGGKDNVSVLIVAGEQFAATAALVPEKLPQPSSIDRRAVWFACGFALAAVLAAVTLFAWRQWWQPAPPAVRVAAGETLMVGPGSAFKTIGDAMAKARAGDTVEVSGGEYRETVQLKNGVTVRSRVPRQTILRASALNPDPLNVAITALNVRHARVSGFRILADKEMALAAGVLLDNSSVEIDDLEIAGSQEGIRVLGGEPILRANSIHDTVAEGVVIDRGAVPWLSHNAIGSLRATLGTRPVLIGNVFPKKEALSLPEGFDMQPVLRFNYFLGAAPAKPRKGARK